MKFGGRSAYVHWRLILSRYAWHVYDLIGLTYFRPRYNPFCGLSKNITNSNVWNLGIPTVNTIGV